MIILNYKGFWNCNGKCGMDIKEQKNKCIVVFTELPDNTGTSITNMYEHLATELFNQVLSKRYTYNQIMWIEHYPKESRSEGYPESYDEVIMEYDDRRFKHPKWLHMKNSEIKDIMV